MNKITDDTQIGLCCSCCGTYFIAAHGYPVECAFCYEESTPSEDEDRTINKAIFAELGE